VIRLGDFSPFGQLFTLGNFLKILEGLLNFGLLFLQLVHVIYVITWTKQRLGQIFVDFFYKHGHPDPMLKSYLPTYTLVEFELATHQLQSPLH
jgi:hypothetical protein